jgi:hypothetical protein
LISPFLPLKLQANTPSTEPYPVKNDDAFWRRIREDYDLKPEYINLENGYYNFIPKPTMAEYLLFHMV